MSTKPPTERETPTGDDRQVEQFLAKAGPIITAHRGLTPSCRRMLADIGRSLGLSDQQMADALRSLLSGGAQTKGPGKPPPLPRRTDPASPSTAQPSEAAAPAQEESPREPRSKPRKTAPASDSKQGKAPTTKAPAPPQPAATKPPAAAPAGDNVSAADKPSARDRSPAADSAAVSAPPSAPTVQPAVSAVPAPPPPPEPPAPPGPKPCDAFCGELRRAFSKVGKEGALSEKAELKLARSGKASFELSEIYARHLVYEVAAECGVPVVSQIRLARQQKPSDSEDQRDAKIRDFLDRITPIIAEQRGINVRSRVKMGAVAREMGLSDDDVEQALKSLQKATDTPEQTVRWLTEREEAYARRLRRRLQRRSGSALTFAKENDYIEAGMDRYGVTEAFVRETLRKLMTEQDIRYISAKQAREHVARLVDEKIDNAQRILPQERRRLQLEGAQWGLEPDDVDAIIREKHVEIGGVARSRQLRTLALLAVCAMLVVGVVGGLAVLILWRSFSPTPADPPQTAGLTPSSFGGAGPSSTEVESKPRVPRWWDSRLAIYVQRAEVSSPNCADTLDKIRSEDPAVRGQAYATLVGQVPDPLPEGAGAAAAQHVLRLGELEQVVTGCYALDPDDEAVGCLRAALLDCVPPPHSELPNSAMVFRKAFWAVRVALASRNHDRIQPERAAELSLAIGHAVGTTLPPSDEPGNTNQASLDALCNQLYRLLIASAPTQPNLVLGLHTTLALEAGRYLDAAKRLALDTDLLVALLPVLGNTWPDWEKLIERCVMSRDAGNVLRIVDVYERLDNESLQEYLRQPLLLRAGVRDARTVAEVASSVRKTLGGSERSGPRTAAERAVAFQQRAAQALENLAAGPDQPDRLLTEVIRLQHASTLGCALAQHELGFPTFDEVNGRKPESLISSRTAADGEAARPRLSTRARSEAEGERNVKRMTDRLLVRQVAILGNLRIPQSQRLEALSWLAIMSSRLPDIDPQQGDKIAEYLLLQKTEYEHIQIAIHIKAVCRWKSVRLGLANHIEASRLRIEHRQEVLSVALGREITADETDSSWPTRMRRDLMLSVVHQLAGAAVPVASAPAVYDRASNLLHDYYCIQARLHGVLPAKYMITETPAAVLELLIEQQAADLSGRVKRPADVQYVRDVSHHMAAARYVGQDHLARSLLLERIWLRLLNASVAVEHPERAAEADDLVAQLGRRDAAARHILTQLRDGHETILRMWQLACTP